MVQQTKGTSMLHQEILVFGSDNRRLIIKLEAAPRSHWICYSTGTSHFDAQPQPRPQGYPRESRDWDKMQEVYGPNRVCR